MFMQREQVSKAVEHLTTVSIPRDEETCISNKADGNFCYKKAA